MLKDFKSLFIKTDEEETEKNALPTEKISFPENNSSNASQNSSASQPPPLVQDPAIAEVLKIYESGLDSINMPGYDFYEFYQSVNVAGRSSEQAYKMAYQMAKTLDKTITTDKLVHDAEFYISKINEVHSQYVTQGQAKLNSIEEKKSAEKTKLSTEIDQATARITQLKAELQQLESDINSKRAVLIKIDENYHPQETSIKEKLSANDIAHKISIGKLNIVKDNISKFIKDQI